MAQSEEFKKTAKKVRFLAAAPTDDEFADMYSLYKQATVGDCNQAKPGIDDNLGLLKFNAWQSLSGMSKEDAAMEYIRKGQRAAQKYGVKDEGR